MSDLPKRASRIVNNGDDRIVAVILVVLTCLCTTVVAWLMFVPEARIVIAVIAVAVVALIAMYKGWIRLIHRYAAIHKARQALLDEAGVREP